MKTLIASFDDTRQATEAAEALKVQSVPEDDGELVTNRCEGSGPHGSECLPGACRK